MGLDVLAVARAYRVEDPTLSQMDDLIRIRHGEFPMQAGDLVDDGYYDCVSCDDFLSMGYGRYGYLRELIAEVAGYEKQDIPEPHYSHPNYHDLSYYYRNPHIATIYINEIEEGPFIEMINFSDCEGVICSEVSKKLYKDFDNYLKIAEEKLDEYYLQKYKDLMGAFKYASDDGFVRYG